MADEPTPELLGPAEPGPMGSSRGGGPPSPLRWEAPGGARTDEAPAPPLVGGAPPAPPPTPPAARRGRSSAFGWRGVLVGAVVGALVGALVAGGLVAALDTGGTTTITRVIGATPDTVIGRPATQIGSGSDIASVVAKAEPAIVAVTTGGGPGSGNGDAGTGFVITSDGYIATNNHVVEGANGIQVQLHDGRIVSARTVGHDVSTDLAVLKVNATGLPAVQLGDSNTVQIGDAVIAIGNALALEGGLSVTNGIISGLHRRVPEQNGAVLVDMLQTDAAINPGNSGGPLLDSQARVIGINTAIANPGVAQNIGFAIPISRAIPVFDDLRTGRKPAFLGVSTTDITPQIASQLNLTVTQGALVNQVTSGTPAAAAGIRRNDVIVQIAQAAITASADVQTAVRALQPGTTVPIVLVRGGQRQTVQAKLTVRPDAG